MKYLIRRMKSLLAGTKMFVFRMDDFVAGTDYRREAVHRFGMS
jgi:hypothetical protein